AASIADVGQIVRIIREVIADADLQMVAHVAIHPEHYAGSAVIGLEYREAPHFEHTVPLTREQQIGAQDPQLCLARIPAARSLGGFQFSAADRVLDADAEPGGASIVRVDVEDAALL